MPQMGESIAEGTIVRWIKKVGEKVDRDEPLFEISTDKVDAEIPSPAAGVVTEIRVKEGETVPVNSVVAVIGAASTAPSANAEEPKTPPAPAPKPVEPPRPSPQAAEAAGGAGGAKAAAPSDTRRGEGVPGVMEDALHQRSSPLVRKIAKEHN
ncbi:MAG TPA: biotin/lipoyl-containing protein, partial [Vicinamibacterales bacterium]|nr:biotin/lipoyl-containing protein [Vicinamibacterales bacterium]